MYKEQIKELEDMLQKIYDMDLPNWDVSTPVETSLSALIIDLKKRTV